MRKYRDDEDYWKIRAFLREVFLRNGRRQRSWDVVRFDYWRWHGVANLSQFSLQDVVYIWETPDGQIGAMLTPENLGEAFMHVAPGFASTGLEAEMLATAEGEYAVRDASGVRKLCVWVNQYESQRQELLAGAGYTRSGAAEYQRRRTLDAPVPAGAPAAGYTVRPMGDGLELLERCYASGRGFHPNDIQYAINNRKDVGWYRNIQNAPLYRRDLDIVAIAPDGSVASFCTVWFDDVTRSGVFEPVATVPEHQRRGLGQAVMCEGLRRLKRMGATQAMVGSYSEAAGKLYASVGFTEYELCEAWEKDFA
jgi:mycothiol synthase